MTIIGSDFFDISNVLFGAIPASSFTVVSPTEIQAVSPLHVAETTNVYLTYLDDSSDPSSEGLFTFNKVSTTTDLVSSANPSFFGQSVIFTATVTHDEDSDLIPTGSITFMDGETALATVELDEFGEATFITDDLEVGYRSLTAVYDGDDYFVSSTGQLSQTVNKADTTTALTSSTSSTTYGQEVTFTATVAAVSPGAGTRTGTVTFRDGWTILGSVTLDANGQATFPISTLTVGSHSITATYDGDDHFHTSTSSSVGHTVTKAATTASLSASAGTVTVGQGVTVTATIAPPQSGMASPTGMVTFYLVDDADNVLSWLGMTSLGGGQGMVGMSFMTTGTKRVKAVYGGDANYLGSVAYLTLTVVPAGSP